MQPRARFFLVTMPYTETSVPGAEQDKLAKALYDMDSASALRMSHESPVVKELYENWYDGFGGHKAHHDLHTSYVARNKYGK